MKALVAGGAGFIGSHLIDALLNKGIDVVCVDNFFIGTNANIVHLHNNPKFTFYEVNLDDYQEIDKVFACEAIDYVFHMAANSDIQASAKSPDIEYKNTYTTTFNLLECMRKYGVNKMFFASTSAVYGEKLGMQVAEDTTPLKPISYYGAAKLGSEALISAYSYMNDFDVLVFRFPNVIGPRLTHGVIFDFVRKLKTDPCKLTILGNGQQAKPYMHVFDLIKGIISFMNKPNGVLVYNIGVEKQTTVTEIADAVCKGMNLEGVEYIYTGGAGGWKGDVPRFSYDLARIHAAGWAPQWESYEAVLKTVQEVLE